MKTEYNFPGGKVVRVSGRKWDVYAPGGRFLKRYPTLKQAVTKAEHWDKWDALGSVASFIPCTSSVILDSLASGEGVDEEKVRAAITTDMLIMVLSRLSSDELERVLVKLEEEKQREEGCPD